jgi:cobalt-zinc-cadmium efflux system protein
MAGHQHTHHGNETRLAIAAALTGVFMVAEIAGGIISGSLALIADAGHMLTDFASLAMAWFAFRLSRRPADWKRTYGFDRFQVIVAFANGLTLFFIAGWIIFEAIQRLMNPVDVLGPVMAIVAAAGLAVNIAAFAVLHSAGAENHNLNMRGAMLHVMGDLLGSVAALVAAGIIITTGWMPADPILSVLVALIILRGAWRVVSEAGHILLEGTPSGFEVDAVISDLVDNLDGIDTVHHVHAWSITEDRRMVTLQARISDNIATTDAIAVIKSRLRENHGIDHATVEIERHDPVAT